MDPRFLEALAQLETAGGKKTVKGPNGEDSFNLYNIKDFSGKGFRALDKAEGSNDAYRVYGSPDAATADLIGLLSRKYPKALEATDRQQFAQALKDGGYATDPQYVEKFVSTFDSLASLGDEPVRPAQAAPARDLSSLYAAAATPRPPKTFELKKTARAAAEVAAVPSLTVTQASADQWFARSTDQEVSAAKRVEEANQQSFIDIARASWMSTFGADVMKRLTRPDYAPDGFVPTEDDLAGHTVDEINTLRQATSRAEFERLKWEIQDYKDQLAEAGKSGLGWAIAGGLIAGAPEGAAAGLVTSLAFAKSAYGSIKLAEQGRRAAAAASAAAENIGGNVAMTAAQDYLSPHVGPQDYVMAAAGGALATLLHAPRIFRAGTELEQKLLRDIIDREMESKAADVRAAKAELGEDATPQQVAQRVAERQVERIQTEVRANTARLGEDRQLVPREINDELMGDAPTAPVTTGSEKLSEAATAAVGKDNDYARAAEVKWNRRGFQNDMRRSILSEAGAKDVSTITNGRTLAEVEALPAGVHLSPEVAANPHLAPHVEILRELAAKYLPDSRIYIGDTTTKPGRRGEIISTGKTHLIALSKQAAAKNADELFHAAKHEIGHAIFHENAGDIPADLMKKIRSDYSQFVERLLSGDHEALGQRVAITSPNANFTAKTKVTPYVLNFDEYLAEQYVKHLTKLTLDGDTRLSSGLRSRLIAAVRKVFEYFQDLGNLKRARALGKADEGAHEFFSRVLDGTLAQSKQMDEYLDASIKLPELMAADQNFAARTDADIAKDYGLDTLAADTPAQKARLKAMVHLYRKAEAYPMPDPARMSKLLQSAPLQAVAPTALKLLQSANPVARMVAAELLESGGGAGGRRSTASVAKYIFERQFMGNSINEFQAHYTGWRNANGGNMREDFFGGKLYQKFNREVAAELENRLQGRETYAHPAIKAAADTLTAAYERMRVTQQELKTPGWAALPPSSEGYMPHRMSPGKIRAMTPDQGRVLHSVLAEQFRTIEGFDEAFSNRLASKYIDIVRKRGTAGYSAPVGVHSEEAADIVAESARAMGMSQDEANALAKRVMKAAPSHTRHRLQLDLTREYEADGGRFSLLDLFETDQLSLLRAQSSRVSGEAALVRHGIIGSTGLKLLRDAMSFGAADGKAENAALEAFDQVAAEFLGQPFGTQQSKWLDRAMQFNSLASLGGMGFNQLAETINGAATLGVRHALASVGSFARLRSEIIALSHGQRVNNPIIGSLETYGAEFGTDHYKMRFPFDMPDRATETYGVETLTAADRLLRSGLHLQGKLSMWRAITAAQERGMAEQIVHKALRYARDGLDSKALADMGIDSDLAAAIRRELPRTARWEGDRLVEFDITKMENREAADAFVQAVHRGTRQIIQGTFIGETGKWAHSSLLKLMLQFKTFSLIAIDKQWNRQVGNHGTAAALGLLLGTMSLAAPIYMIRAGLQSIGRPDRDAYLQKALHPVEIARQTLNYVALSGLAGDLLDALSAVAGYQPTGGRSGQNKSAVGNIVAPAVGKVNDIYGAIQNSREGTHLAPLMRELPFARLPYLYPAMNALRSEDY